MPTVVLLDVSLSMTRRVQTPEQQDCQRRHLAVRGLYTLFDYLSNKFKLEFTSLLVFSSLYEVVVPFTRDYESLKQGCMEMEVYNKTCVDNALSGVASFIVEEWGGSVPCQVILVTDGCPGTGRGSLKELLNNVKSGKETDLTNIFPFPFPCRLHIVCISTSSEAAVAVPLYQELCDLNGHGGGVYVPEQPLSIQSVQQVFTRIAQTNYVPYEGVLSCGHLKSKITLSPSPSMTFGYFKSVRTQSNNAKEYKFPNEIQIIGYLDAADASNPPCCSRHLVIPTGNITDGNEGEKTSEDDGKTPSFCVLLHGSLKVEKMVSLVKLGSDWFGMLYSWADSKKKSNLVLAVFEISANIPWLGNLNQLGPAAEFDENPYLYDQNEETEETPFPVHPNQRRSYNSPANAVWIRASGLQADILKLLRYCRRLPDKQTQFYKELNRIRRAALCYSYLTLLDSLADMLEKEANSTNAETTMQLKHAAKCLRQAASMDLNKQILPLTTGM